MIRFLAVAVLAILTTACDAITGTGRAPDPYITIRVRNLLDTTTATGRAHWHIYALLTGPYTAQNGVANQGAISVEDVRNGHSVICVNVVADSVGQRLVSVIAVADTTTSSLSADATAEGVVNAWYSGNTVLPLGWRALLNVPTDAWDSEQFDAGHGRTPDDPIKWGLDWTGDGSVSFYERSPADTARCNSM